MTMTISEIAAPSDYNDPARDIVHFNFKVINGDFKETVKEARQNRSSSVVPAAGCVVVLDGSSIGESSLYELSGMRLSTELRMSDGCVRSFGYCERKSIDKARAEFLALAKTKMSRNIEALKKDLETSEQSLFAINELM